MNVDFVWGLLTALGIGLIALLFSVGRPLLSNLRFYQRAHDPGDKTISSVLVYGGGRCGQLAVEGLRRFRADTAYAVGYVDDYVALGTNVEGLSVLGKLEDVPQLVANHSVDEIMIAMAYPGELEDKLIDLLEAEIRDERVKILQFPEGIAEPPDAAKKNRTKYRELRRIMRQLEREAGRG